MYILGISCFYHDASATLVKDGIVVAAAEEERFSRKKHDNGFPVKAIAYCLKSQGITVDDIAYVAFYEKPLLKFERILHQHFRMFPQSFKTFITAFPSWLNEKLRITKYLKKKIGYHGDILFIEHHLAHAASAFLPSPYADAAIVTVDGVGEWATATYGVGHGAAIELQKQISFPHSLGLLYSTVTAYLGFSVNNSEYKVMGLSAYGDRDRTTNRFYKKLQHVIDIKADGSFHLRMEYFTYHYADRMPSEKFCALLEGPVTRRDSEMDARHQDIAAAVQLITEDVMLALFQHVQKETGQENVVFAGGVALNSVLNGKILSNTSFKNIWIQPNASDGGTSMGAALYAYCTILKNPRIWKLSSAYLGPRYTNSEIEAFLRDSHVNFSTFIDDEDLLSTVAKKIYDNQVVSWFQGGMEWGPRALGARSILSNPTNKKMQEILNLKVKHRERFRPFAPVVCIDDALTYFVCDEPIPEPTDFMLMVYPVKAEYRDRIPAVTHIDGSGRLQTVRREQNPLYYDLIKKFGTYSGIPILINTSFNIRGEPIVCTPVDAYRCMMGTGIDSLIMGNFLINRSDNPHDMWDSEVGATD